MFSSIRTAILLSFTGLVLFSCGGSKQVAEVEEPKPYWVENRPVDANYYIGIGIASKGIHPNDYAEQAKKHALNEMASEIKVQVSSNSMLFSFENKEGFNDEFKSFTKLSTNELIENYEQIGVWENQSEYRVFYRLSKAQYQKDKQARIDKAVSSSMESVKRADDLAGTGNYTNSLLSFFQAIEPIKPYLGESLETSYNEKDVYLGDYIASRISDIVSNFTLRASNSEINTIWGKGITSDQLSFELVDAKGERVGKMPVLFHYSHGIIRPKNAITDESGRVVSSINKIKKPIPAQTFTATVDFAKLFLEGKSPDAFTEKLLKQFAAPKAEVRINIQAPAVYITSNENVNGKKAKEGKLKIAASEAASKKGFRLVSKTKDADLFVKINANTKEAGVSSGLYTTLLTGYVSIIDAESNKEIYSEELKDVKGVKANYASAGLNAMDKAADRVRSRVIPRFYRNYMK